MNNIKQKEIIKVYNYDSQFFGRNILINQVQKTGKTLDQAFLLEDKNSKVFLGFQMEFYSKETKIKNPEKFSKEAIKKSLRNILVEGKLKYGFTFQNWHYYLIFFYDDYEKENNNLNKSLVNFCEREDLEYIYYFPSRQIFLNRFYQIIEKIQLNFNSYLELNNELNPYLIFAIFLEKFLEQKNNINNQY